MKIAFLGTGAWGYCLASLLASNGHLVTSWSIDAALLQRLNAGEGHPFLNQARPLANMKFTLDLKEALDGAELIVESVTSSGFRQVLNQIKEVEKPDCSLVITSKGIEQNTGEILPEIALEIFGEDFRPKIGILSGPSFAAEVIAGRPTSVVASAYDAQEMRLIAEAFTNASFRVYPNHDIKGVAFGGALKNIIAIACGIADGMELGNSIKAALITRGLHEMKKLFAASGCRIETLYGLSGLGDLCLTCNSPLSRNYSFGMLLGKGGGLEESKDKIKMVVEGAYTCVSALQLSKKFQIDMPITESVYKIIYEGKKPQEAVFDLMNRPIREEHV